MSNITFKSVLSGFTDGDALSAKDATRLAEWVTDKASRTDLYAAIAAATLVRRGVRRDDGKPMSQTDVSALFGRTAKWSTHQHATVNALSRSGVPFDTDADVKAAEVPFTRARALYNVSAETLTKHADRIAAIGDVAAKISAWSEIDTTAVRKAAQEDKAPGKARTAGDGTDETGNAPGTLSAAPNVTEWLDTLRKHLDAVPALSETDRKQVVATLSSFLQRVQSGKAPAKK